MEKRKDAEEEEEEDSGDEEQLQRVHRSPELYIVSKFSLAAYLICWTLLTLLQRLRSSMPGPQVQEALEEAPSDPGRADECRESRESGGWTERTADGTVLRRDSWDGEDGFSSLVEAEHLYTEWRLENGLEAGDSRAQSDEQNPYCERESVDQTRQPEDVEELSEERTVVQSKEDVADTGNSDSRSSETLETLETLKTFEKESTSLQSTEEPGELTSNRLPGSQSEGVYTDLYKDFTRCPNKGDTDTVSEIRSTEAERKNLHSLDVYSTDDICECIDNKKERSGAHIKNNSIDVENKEKKQDFTQNRKETQTTQHTHSVDNSIDAHCVNQSTVTSTSNTKHTTACQSCLLPNLKTYNIDTEKSTKAQNTSQKAQTTPDFCQKSTFSTVCSTADKINKPTLQSGSCEDSQSKPNTETRRPEVTGRRFGPQTCASEQAIETSSTSAETSISENGDTSCLLLICTTRASHDVAGSRRTDS
ncbi:uncharacterized protein LOC125802538 [Astyanax mexicanus]|uniref:uncharacterized protein LOC125802538 n=1 Tax=Astyanax mexicanus TaxID=7994 RepID=UPI0020CB33EB|nr:uncharacterized protein LOC125802538 [Astyanax mexicanus]